MAGSTEMLAAFRELTTAKQLERSDLLDLLRDGIQAALVRKFGPNVKFELNVDELQGTIRVVRLRPAFIFQRRSASEQRRIFAGPFVPNWIARPGALPVLPLPRTLDRDRGRDPVRQGERTLVGQGRQHADDRGGELFRGHRPRVSAALAPPCTSFRSGRRAR